MRAHLDHPLSTILYIPSRGPCTPYTYVHTCVIASEWEAPSVTFLHEGSVPHIPMPRRA